MYINKAIIVGNLTKDPELKSLPSGQKICSFSVATNRTWYDTNKQKQEAVDYHNIVCFGKQAEVVAQWMKKGSQVYVEGRMTTRSWDDKDTKKKMYRTEVVAENIQFGSSKKKENTNNGEAKDEEIPSEEEINKRNQPQTERARLDNEGTIDYGESINPEDIPF